MEFHSPGAQRVEFGKGVGDMRKALSRAHHKSVACLELFDHPFLDGPLVAMPIKAEATDLTAGVVMEKMTSEQRPSYIAGVVERLAYARYAKDGKADQGMKCIYQWFYQKKKAR